MDQFHSRYPMLLAPAFKDYLWGGDRLAANYGKNTEMRPIAESWELSCHPDGLSAVASGALKGMALADVLDKYPDWVKTGYKSRQFPILIKFIDAKQNLSLQVHPNDSYARRHENSLGKNEAWYVIDCEPGAQMILGLNREMPKDEIKARLNDGTILDCVKTVSVKPGDGFYIPAGLLHAVGGGILIAEVQQSSNVTYRVYDYNRTGPDGKPRPLHIGNAAEVIDAGARAVNAAEDAPVERRGGYDVTDLIDWPFFRMDKMEINGEAALNCNEVFQALLIIDGSLTLTFSHIADGTGRGGASDADCPKETTLSVSKGDCVFIPAGLGKYALRGKGAALLTEPRSFSGA